MIIALTLCERGKRRKQRKKGKKIGDILTLMIILWYWWKDFDKDKFNNIKEDFYRWLE